MRKLVMLTALLGAVAGGCGAEVDGARVGQINLSLKGAGSLGGQFSLANASFTVTGAANLTISGDPDTITQSLPVGAYTIKLNTGWKLQKVVSGAPTDISAVLSSSNPQAFVVNPGVTTQVSWLFNVTGAQTSDDDLEVVAVANGAASIALAAGELAWSNFGNGNSHTCGITASGSLRCWGANSYGQLGYGDTTSKLTPPSTAVAVGVGRLVKRVVASKISSGSFTCAVLDDNTVKCWGYNGYGQLGYGDSTDRHAPADATINLGSSNTARTIAVGDYHTCVILDSNAVKCWGYNNYGQLGYGDSTQRLAPAATPINLGPGNAAKEIVANASYSCALLANNTVKCWGYNGNGQLGYGDSSNRLAPPDAPVNLGTGHTAKRLTAGVGHVCAILDDNSVKCWGYNAYGQLGYGDTTNRTAPPDGVVNLGAGRTAVSIAAGNTDTCALLDNGDVKCWGNNAQGQLGYEDTNQRSAPASIGISLGAGRAVHRLQPGFDATCALLVDNGLKCWGINSSGMFGIGTSGENHGDQLNEMGDNLPEVLP